MNLQTTAQSPTLAMHNLSSLREAEGRPVVKLGFGQSPFGPPASVLASLQDNAHRHDYAPVAGLPELRRAVAAYHRKYDGLACTDQNVLISAGSKALLYAVMASYKTATIIIPAPSWVSYAPQADLLGHGKIALRRNTKSDWRVTPRNLQIALDQCPANGQKILILNAPGNPDGLSYSEAELSALADIAKAQDVLILSDEIYGRLHFDGGHTTIATYYPEGTIVTSGLSKWCGAGGWRLGTAVVPDALSDLKDTMIGILSEIVSCAPTPIQVAAIKAYEDTDDILHTIEKRREILKAIGLYTYQKLTDAGLSCTKPDGGFYSFVDFMPFQEVLTIRGLLTSDDVCQKLMTDKGVALLSGSAFGMEDDYLSARLAFVDFDGEAALKAAETQEINDTFLQTYCKKTYDGILYITEWLKKMQ